MSIIAANVVFEGSHRRGLRPEQGEVDHVQPTQNTVDNRTSSALWASMNEI
jgi:hypothetical protein